MITEISRQLEAILSVNESVFAFGCVRSEEELRAMINTDSMKSVGYTIAPTKITKNGQFVSELVVFIVDIADSRIEVLNATVDTNMLVAKDIVVNLDLCEGEVKVDTEYLKEEENDSVTVVTKCVLECYT